MYVLEGALKAGEGRGGVDAPSGGGAASNLLFSL